MSTSNLGEILRYYRKSKKYSVKEVIEILDKDYNITISPKTLYSWENNQNQPSADSLLILCKIYEITNILDSFGYTAPGANTPFYLSRDEKDVIQKYRTHKYFKAAVHKLLEIDE